MLTAVMAMVTVTVTAIDEMHAQAVEHTAAQAAAAQAAANQAAAAQVEAALLAQPAVPQALPGHFKWPAQRLPSAHVTMSTKQAPRSLSRRPKPQPCLPAPVVLQWTDQLKARQQRPPKAPQLCQPRPTQLTSTQRNKVVQVKARIQQTAPRRLRSHKPLQPAPEVQWASQARA